MYVPVDFSLLYFSLLFARVQPNPDSSLMRKYEIRQNHRLITVPESIIRILNRIEMLQQLDKNVASFREGVLFCKSLATLQKNR